MVPTSRILPDGVVDSAFQSGPPRQAPKALLGRHSPEAAGIDVAERGIRLKGRLISNLKYVPKFLIWRHSPMNGIQPLDGPVYSVGF
jgi:hypothetical protein